MSIRVVVADDQEIVREGFAALLATQPDIKVVGTAADGEEAVRVCRSERPNVVLMDVRMPGLDGIEATRQLTRDHGTRSRVLMLTTFDLDEYVYDALGAGASGFLLKDVTAEQLREEFDAVVLAGGATAWRDLPAKGREVKGVYQAMEYLPWANHVQQGDIDAPAITAAGKHVIIIGGGDTGADCLGTAHRQGAASVTQLEILPTL